MKFVLSLIAFLLSIPTTGQHLSDLDVRPFIPEGYVLMDKIHGDLNKDGVEDFVLVIKNTSKDMFVEDTRKGTIDRNRRGLIILFNTNNQYEQVLANYDCFSSEQEDAGVYSPPEMSISIEHGILKVYYTHGRNGYWFYLFRYKNSDFELIGYDAAFPSELESEFVVFHQLSINFLTQKKVKRRVVDVDSEGNERFKESWDKISIDALLKLSEIKDFDGLTLDKY